MRRIKKDFMFRPEYIDYINEVKDKNYLKYNSEALELIIREHKEIKSNTLSQEAVIDVLGDEVARKINIALKILLEEVKASDKNTQIMIEMFNAMFFKENYGMIVTTSEDISKGLEMATEEVKKRIIAQRVTKLDRKF